MMEFFECISCGEKMPAFDVAHVCTKGTLAPKGMPIGELNAIGSGTGKSSFIEPEFAEKIPMWKLGIMIHGYRLVQTCSACPEQYDVFDDLGQQVAYFRLRHGGFRVQVPDVGGEEVYHANPKGDGVFYEDERVKYLTEAILAVQEYYINRRWYKPEDYK
jgi:hypothetical protein